MLIAMQWAWAETVPFGKGQLTVKYVARNAVRIQYNATPDGEASGTVLPDWSYVKDAEVSNHDITVKVDAKRHLLQVKDKQGRVVFTATRHDLQGEEATLTFKSPKDEYLYGLGQFQDGYTNVRGLSRRLTQVNTQISLPMLLSSKGYGVLWNNYGMTEYNPSSQSVSLKKGNGEGVSEEVNVTSTEGGKKEVRQRSLFTLHIVTRGGEYHTTLTVFHQHLLALLVNLDADIMVSNLVVLHIAPVGELFGQCPTLVIQDAYSILGYILHSQLSLAEGYGLCPRQLYCDEQQH
jgi:alpha-D-xyloside xylohydrolase